MTTGLALPFRGDYAMTQRFGAVDNTLETPAYIEQLDGRPWRASFAPFPGGELHSYVHPGVDYGMPVGTKLYAPRAGRLILTGHHPRGGLWIILKVAGRKTWFYMGHLDSVALPVDSTFGAGALVAASGDSGLTTGPHLHLEVRHGSLAFYYNVRRLLTDADQAGVPWIVSR